MDNEIIVNEHLLYEITSRYVREYETFPSTHKQAMQYAYHCGRIDQKHEEQNLQVVLTKHEIKALETSLIKKILADIESEYDLNYGEMLLNPRDFYDLVEGYLPSDFESYIEKTMKQPRKQMGL